MLFHMSLTEFSCFIFTSSFEMPAVFPKVGGWVPKPAKVGMTGFRPSAQGFASTRYIAITFNEVKKKWHPHDQFGKCWVKKRNKNIQNHKNYVCCRLTMVLQINNVITCIYIYIYMCVNKYVYMYMYVHVCVCICIYIYVCMCIYIYIYSYFILRIHSTSNSLQVFANKRPGWHIFQRYWGWKIHFDPKQNHVQQDQQGDGVREQPGFWMVCKEVGGTPSDYIGSLLGSRDSLHDFHWRWQPPNISKPNLSQGFGHIHLGHPYGTSLLSKERGVDHISSPFPHFAPDTLPCCDTLP